MKVEGVGGIRHECDHLTGRMVKGRDEFLRIGGSVAVRAGQVGRRARDRQVAFLSRLLLSGVDILVGCQGGIPFGFQLSLIR